MDIYRAVEDMEWSDMCLIWMVLGIVDLLDTNMAWMCL